MENAGGLLAAGAARDALRVLHYLEATQEADGHWAQNMWLDGRPYWNGLQMDETAFPILLVDLHAPRGAALLRRQRALVADGAQSRVFHRRATARSRSRTDGKKMAAIRRSRWRRKSPRC